jgi:hypothetical protein
MYLVVIQSDDDVMIHIMSTDELEEFINQSEHYRFVTEEQLKKTPEPNNWGNSSAIDVLIIDMNKIVVPVQKTIAWRLPE